MSPWARQERGTWFARRHGHSPFLSLLPPAWPFTRELHADDYAQQTIDDTFSSIHFACTSYTESNMSQDATLQDTAMDVDYADEAPGDDENGNDTGTTGPGIAACTA